MSGIVNRMIDKTDYVLFVMALMLFVFFVYFGISKSGENDNNTITVRGFEYGTAYCVEHFTTLTVDPKNCMAYDSNTNITYVIKCDHLSDPRGWSELVKAATKRCELLTME